MPRREPKNRPARLGAPRARRGALRHRPRRGVLLLVVLSLLVLFLLVGATFVLTTSSSRIGARAVERAHQTSLQPGDRLRRALLQVLRDTNNPDSAIRFHSLLRDTYGVDGFVAHVYAGDLERVRANGVAIGPTAIQPADPNDFNIDPANPDPLGGFAGPAPRNGQAALGASVYAGATPANPLGPTGGQLIDIFVQDDLGLFGSSSPAVPADQVPAVLNDANGNPRAGLRAEYVVDLELNEDGLTTNHTLSRTAGYYNGCLLTVLDGPAAGQTTRIVQYDFINEGESLHRFRVLAFPRADGSPLRLGLNPRQGDPNDLVYAIDSGNPVGVVNDNDPFYGRRIMVNGRPNNGAGVGLNPVAGVAAPKLSAMEVLTTGGGLVGMETALAPHARYFFPETVATFFPAGADPSRVSDYANAGYNPPNDPSYGNAASAFAPLAAAGSPYRTYPGRGGSDESYDAADFQNMFLALQSQRPRPEGRVYSQDNPLPLSPSDPGLLGLLNGDVGVRLDLNDVPIPSFHRPALVNFWFHRLLRAPWLETLVPDVNVRAQAIIDPLGAGLPPAVAGQIAAFKRKFILRPLRADHPSFDGGNPASRYEGRLPPAPAAGLTRLVDTLDDGTPLDDQILFPAWEVTGPWDVDNDGDGVPDSVWVDLGDPVQQDAGGKLYKPLYAILIQDLDGRLNLNANGTREHFAAVDLDGSSTGMARQPINPVFDAANGFFVDGRQGGLASSASRGANLATGASALLGVSGSRLLSSNQLPPGSGWGPGDTTLRSVLSPELVDLQALNPTVSLIGNNETDDYARLLVGRSPGLTPGVVPGAVPFGRYGSLALAGGPPGPGVNYRDTAAVGTLDPLASFKLFDYPAYDPQSFARFVAPGQAALLRLVGGGQPSGFGTSPDLIGRYAAPGLGYAGQPVGEPAIDPAVPSLVYDSPYELRLDAGARRDTPAATGPTRNDDAPYSAAELERLLRPYDADASWLPARLWDVVDSFDGEKLAAAWGLGGPTAAVPANPRVAGSPPASPFRLVENEAAARRRAVTTQSNSDPTPADNWNARLVFGADGRPGAAVTDEDGDGQPDNEAEYNRLPSGDPIDLNLNGRIDPAEEAAALAAFAAGNDDYLVVMGAGPPPQARLIDYLRYRVVLELKRRGAVPPAVLPDVPRTQVAGGGYAFSLTDVDAAEQRVNLVIYGDNAASPKFVRVNGDGLLKLASYGGLLAPEVLAGEKMDLNRPFGDGRDNNGNGVVDEPQEAGEPWIDRDGDGLWENDPFLDTDGDGRFYADANADGVIDGGDFADFDGDGVVEPVVDNLFARQLSLQAGAPVPPVPFDHAQGTDATGSGAAAGGGVVRDDGRMARQLYARHLYCLMLLVADENYLAPFDSRDPQIMNYLDADSTGGRGLPVTSNDNTGPPLTTVAGRIKQDLIDSLGLPEADASARARRIALRKLTCRRIAQWAINCAEMRDPDAICTPFEYDENPWDGWNVTATDDGLVVQVLPIDGDCCTDENALLSRPVAPSGAGWLPIGRYDNNGGPVAPEFRVPAFDQTRGVVFGAERPELLLTEGLATHARRLEDLPGVGDVEQPAQGNTGLEENDNDLDQRLRPRGSVFIELHNPWTETGAPHPELYRDRNGLPRTADVNKDGTDDVAVEGVLLDRVSNVAAPVLVPERNPLTGQYSVRLADGSLELYEEWLARPPADRQAVLTRAPSPVWRMICIEEHPEMRNDDPVDNPIGRGTAAYPLKQALQPLTPRPPGIPPLAAGAMTSTSAALIGVTGGNFAQFQASQLPFQWHQPGPGSAAFWRSSQNKEQADPLRMTNPDFPTFDSFAEPRMRRATDQGRRAVYLKPERYIEREWYFTRGVTPGGEVPTVPIGGDFRVDPEDVRLCLPIKPIIVSQAEDTRPPENPIGVNYAEREQMWPDMVKLRPVPDYGDAAGAATTQLVIYPWRFPPVVEAAAGRYVPLPLAPVLPGRYAVVGSAGVQYRNGNGVLPALAGRFITTLSRTIAPPGPGQPHPLTEGQNGGQIAAAVERCRRIELVPNRNPFLHQVAVAQNGGDECRVLRPVNSAGEQVYVINATDPSAYPTDFNDPAGSRVAANLREFNEQAGQPAFYTNTVNPAPGQLNGDDPTQTRLYTIKPAVAVPIEGMNISMPLDSYWLRKAEIEQTPDAQGELPLAMDWKRDRESGEGEFRAPGANAQSQAGYDQPMDIAPELCLNRTTPNYRSVHLQRLANPLLAWNPHPLRPDGSRHPQHDPGREVNPYCTVDSLSLDLTAFNGVNDHETRIEGADRTDGLQPVIQGGAEPETLHERGHSLPPHGQSLPGYNPQPLDRDKILMTLASNAKGFHEQVLEYGPDPAGGTDVELNLTLQPGRRFWAQERPNQVIDILDKRIDVFDTQVSAATGPLRVHEDLSPRGPGEGALAMNFPIRHTLGYDNQATVRQIINKPPAGVTGADKPFYPARVELRGVFASDLASDPQGSAPAYPVDVNGDGILGDLVGAPRIDLSNAFASDNPRTEDVNEQGQPDYRDDMTNPWLVWNDRPFVSGAEALLTPASSQARLLTDFSFTNPFAAERPNRYDGVAAVQGEGPANLPGNVPDSGAGETNAARIGSSRYPYGHLLNFFQGAPSSAVTLQVNDQAIPVGAANFHRAVDFLHTPTRFVGSEVLLDPNVFNAGVGATPGDPRGGLLAPFNRVSRRREPGKVNLNTVVGRHNAAGLVPVGARHWSDVYDGLMHRRQDGSFQLGGQLVQAGHSGPAWRDVVLSRRGYTAGFGISLDYSPDALNPNFPTRFANPFRSATAADLVPLLQLEQLGADASMLRAHPFSPGGDGVWGRPLGPGPDGQFGTGDEASADDDFDLVENNTTEAGLGSDPLLNRANGSLPDSLLDNAGRGVSLPVEPLFSEGSTEPALAGGRNAGVAYGPITRLDNLTTTRSGNFAVWITVGFFEVTNAPSWDSADVQARFGGSRELYDRVYPDGYQLGRELYWDTGDTRRFRGFWVIDRTLPVAFKPGENINTERAILLERRID